MRLLGIFPKLVQKAPKQIISEAWEQHDCILQHEVNLFCWKRAANPQIVDYLETCLDKVAVPIAFTTSADELPSEICKARKIWDPSYDVAADAFWADVYLLVLDFLNFSETGFGTVHLKVIDDNACTKFHVDGYRLRLFTTYIGPGTEWLPERASNRSALGKTNEQIIKDPSQIHSMDEFDVGILKGENPTGVSQTKGIIHRSPKIEHIGEKRVILRIDI